MRRRSAFTTFGAHKRESELTPNRHDPTLNCPMSRARLVADIALTALFLACTLPLLALLFLLPRSIRDRTNLPTH